MDISRSRHRSVASRSDSARKIASGEQGRFGARRYAPWPSTRGTMALITSWVAGTPRSCACPASAASLPSASSGPGSSRKRHGLRRLTTWKRPSSWTLLGSIIISSWRRSTTTRSATRTRVPSSTSWILCRRGKSWTRCTSVRRRASSAAWPSGRLLQRLPSFLGPGPCALADLLQLGFEAFLATGQLRAGAAAGAVDSVHGVLRERSHPPAEPASGLLAPLRRKQERDSRSHQRAYEKPGYKSSAASSLHIVHRGSGRGLLRTVLCPHVGSVL